MKLLNTLATTADTFIESNLAAIIMSMVLVCVLWSAFK
jgi:hypothetical protein